MRWTMTRAAELKRMVIFVSKADHVLQELLWRVHSDELNTDIKMVISNHPDLEDAVAPWGIPFHHIPVTKDAKPEAEAAHLKLLSDEVDVVVLARYMQILSPAFLTEFTRPIINIHHSFLPAFKGANPYRAAHERGVKLIGATAHYVTPELDAGPIIEDDRVIVHQNKTIVFA